MQKDNLVKNDLSPLLITLNDVIERIYDLGTWNDDDEILSLGLMFIYRSLYRYIQRYYDEERNI